VLCASGYKLRWVLRAIVRQGEGRSTHFDARCIDAFLSS